MEKKKYWLKLDKDFLKSPQIKVIKNMPNGRDYIIFYLSLLLESVETVGHLRFSELVPYSDEMLSSITDTNIDIVRSATKIFVSLGLMEMMDDGTIFMTQVAQMTGKESESAERVRQYRLREKEKGLLHCNDSVTTGNDEVTDSNDNKEKEKKKEEDKQSTYKKENKYIELKEENIEENKEGVCEDNPEKIICHLGSLFKEESCFQCMKKRSCKLPPGPNFKIKHQALSFEEWNQKIEELYEKWIKMRKLIGESTDIQFFDYDFLEEELE